MQVLSPEPFRQISKNFDLHSLSGEMAILMNPIRVFGDKVR